MKILHLTFGRQKIIKLCQLTHTHIQSTEMKAYPVYIHKFKETKFKKKKIINKRNRTSCNFKKFQKFIFY